MRVGGEEREQLKYNVSLYLRRALQFIISKPDTKLREAEICFLHKGRR